MLKLKKRIINQHLVPHLPKGERGPECKVGLWRIVRSIVHRVKTGTQWRELPVRGWFGKHTITWNTVYYYYNKWRQPLLCKDGSWQRMLESLLEINKAELDMSSVQLDGSHTPAWRGGEAVAYQGRKKRKTTNMLFLTDSQGIPRACSEPVAGNHSDLFEVEKSVAKIIGTLGEAGIEHQGLFLNADCADFHGLCKPRCIVFFIFLPPVDDRANAVDQLIAHCIENGHFVLSFADFALVVVLYFSASGRPVSPGRQTWLGTGRPAKWKRNLRRLRAC